MSEQNKAWNLAHDFVQETNCHIYLTGKAGTGKTTFLHAIKKECAKRMVVTAPTGVAAINAGGVTLHSFFQLPFGPLPPGSMHNDQQKFNKDKIQIIRSLDLLVIDEISMVRGDVLDGINTILRKYRRNQKPFGGVQLLLIGDLHQLPPVVKHDEWKILKPFYPTPYFFSSHTLKKSKLISIELTHIYRQDDKYFIELLNSIRGGSPDTNILTTLNKRYETKDKPTSDAITLCTHNKAADDINYRRLRDIKKKTHSFTATLDGEFPSSNYPTEYALEIKKGAQVMFVRNDPSPEKNYYNGKTGKVTKITRKFIWVQCLDEDEEIIVEPVTWENIEYTFDEKENEIIENTIGSFSQFPLKLAWAITIHKSQGLTFDTVIIDAQAAFAHGQVYVALSRCKTLEKLYLSSPINQKSVTTDPYIKQFSEQVQNDKPDHNILGQAKNSYQRQLIFECYDFSNMQKHLDSLCFFIEANSHLLQISTTIDLAELQTKCLEEITKVGQNFQNQLFTLFSNETLPSEDPVIKERLTKAAKYFTEKIQTHLLSHLVHLEIETDNKELRKKGKKHFTETLTQVAIKHHVILATTKGFSANNYLRAISEGENSKLVKKVKQKKVPLYKESDLEHIDFFEKLKSWRNNKASSENLAHYQVMHQKTLIQIAIVLPDSLKSLKEIKGIGKVLLEKYGEELVDLVVKYKKSKNITKVNLPQHHHTSEAPSQEKKQSTHDYSLELFTKGYSIEEIAQERELTQSTIENHICFNIRRGKIPIEAVLEDDKLEEIRSVFTTMKTITVGAAKTILGAQFSYREIKFALAHAERNN